MVQVTDSYGLFVHGVGTQAAGYSNYAQKWLSAAREPNKTYMREVLWAPVLDSAERAMMREVSRRGSAGRPLQSLVVETLADALCFRNRLDQIFYQLDLAYARLRAPGPVSIFAHSLGVVLALEWLRERPGVEVARLHSFGTNLQLFHLNREGEFVAPSQLRGAGVWINYYDRHDMLGFPVRGWLPQVQDIEVNVGGWFTRWNGLSHTGYYTSKGFWQKAVAPRSL